MAKRSDKGDPKLRVVNEEIESEEVLRLDRGISKVEAVDRIPVEPKPELATRLEGEEQEFERRSLEPDIDSILDEKEVTFDPEEGWKDASIGRPIPYGWFVLIALGLLGAVVISTAINSDPATRKSEVWHQASAERLEENVEGFGEALELIERVEAVLAGYLAADSVEEMLPFVRDQERVRPLMMEWYRDHELRSHDYIKMVDFGAYRVRDRSIWLASATVAGTDERKQLLLEQDEEGSINVDWETDVSYQPMPWDAYVRERPAGKDLDFRVYVEPDLAELYSHEFEDDSKWRVYRLTASRSEEYAFGYVERNGDIDNRLLQLWHDNRRVPTAMILKLGRSEGMQSPRGFFIRELISEHWILTE